MERFSGEETTLSRPTPARRAARAAITTAPAIPGQPPTRRSVPTLFLCASGSRLGQLSAAHAGVVAAAAKTWSGTGGKPISTAINRPTFDRPGWSSVPSLGHPSATVTSASTASPAIWPVSPFTPDGVSNASTGRSDRLIARMAWAWRSRGGPLRPVPRTPSTMTDAARNAVSNGPESCLSPSSVSNGICQPCNRSARGSLSATRTALTGRPHA